MRERAQVVAATLADRIDELGQRAGFARRIGRTPEKGLEAGRDRSIAGAGHQLTGHGGESGRPAGELPSESSNESDS